MAQGPPIKTSFPPAYLDTLNLAVSNLYHFGNHFSPGFDGRVQGIDYHRIYDFALRGN